MKLPSTLLFISIVTVSSFGSPVVLAEKTSKTVDLTALSAWQKTESWANGSKVVGSTTEKKWKSVTDGSGILYNGKEGKAPNLVSIVEHGDVELMVEFMIPKGSNSGIYFMQRYEIQIIDSCGKADEALNYGDCGGIYERWDESKPDTKKKGFEGTAPSTNAATAAGSWQTFHIKFRAPRFDESGKKTENARFDRVEHNGVVIHEDVEVTGPTRGGIGGPEVAAAPFSLQGDHGPVAFRKLEVKHGKFD